MSVYLCPTFGAGYQSFLYNGSPNALGYINTYLAGTNTPAATYTTQAGNVANPTSIELNAAGSPPNEIWLTGGQAYKIIVTDANANVLGTFDGLYGIGDFSVIATAISGTTITASTEFVGPGTTAAQFDNSTRLATTAFVKRAGWQLAGQIVITASTSLTASQAGNCIQVANTTGPITVTLPASNSAAAGDIVCLIWNDSSYTATVAVPSGDTINMANTVLQPGQSMAVYNDGGTVWDKIFNEADTYQAVAPVYADVVGVSPWNPYTVTATITAPKAGWVLAAAKWIGTGGSTSPQAGLYFNGTQFSGDQANPYEQVEYGFVQASAGEVITIQFEIGTQGAANSASLMAWFVPQAN